MLEYISSQKLYYTWVKCFIFLIMFKQKEYILLNFYILIYIWLQHKRSKVTKIAKKLSNAFIKFAIY